MLLNQEPFFKKVHFMSTIDKIIPVYIALVWITLMFPWNLGIQMLKSIKATEGS